MLIKFHFLICLCCPQVSVEAPWLSNIQGSCAVISKGMLTCVDPAAVSLYMLDLHAESQMTKVPLQVPPRINWKLFLNSNLYLLFRFGSASISVSFHFSIYTMELCLFIPSLCAIICLPLVARTWSRPRLSSSSGVHAAQPGPAAAVRVLCSARAWKLCAPPAQQWANSHTEGFQACK